VRPIDSRAIVFSCAALVGCPSPPAPDATTVDTGQPSDASDIVSMRPPFCAGPGSPPDGITLPPGFCARTFAHVQHARVIRFAPGGELFVASPNTPTSGYGGAGPEPSRIAVIPDDDHDGLGDTPVTFLANVDACHALLFAHDALYYSVGTQILRMAYTSGQRTPAAAVVIANLTDGASFVHWPHTLDVADDGTVLVSRGGNEIGSCPASRPPMGAVIALDGTLQGHVLATGLRNPMYLRCQHTRGRCYANELTGDFWDAIGGVEKLILVRDGDDWGYPCCVTRGHSIPDAGTDCTTIASGEHALTLHDTPFGMDFEPGRWPAPWTGALVIALHGSFNTWVGTRVVTIATDPSTGEPMGLPVDFATGWDDGRRDHGRPSDVVFAPDGRLFVANDITGEIIWIAPVGLRPP
jgi:glucose/arabinose dehydrogenase